MHTYIRAHTGVWLHTQACGHPMISPCTMYHGLIRFDACQLKLGMAGGLAALQYILYLCRAAGKEVSVLGLVFVC